MANEQQVHTNESGLLLWGPDSLHHYFHSEGFTDLSVIRNSAEWRRTKGKAWPVPQESVIHLHPADESEAPLRCHLVKDDKHEYYQLQEDK